jgi:hypothetical protein
MDIICRYATLAFCGRAWQQAMNGLPKITASLRDDNRLVFRSHYRRKAAIDLGRPFKAGKR